MNFKEMIEKVESSNEFKEWKTTHENFYLAHFFMMAEEGTGWQLGYSDGDKVATFHVDTLELVPEQEVYKKPESKISALNLDNLTLEYDEVKKIFDETIQKEYSKELLFKTIVLVQNTEEDLYNITGLTRTFKTLNVKINMKGEVISHNLNELVSKG